MEISDDSQPAPSSDNARPLTGWLPVVAIVVPFIVVDAAVCPLMRAISPRDTLSFIVYSSFGLILGQAGLLTCGLVFVRGPIWQRLLVHWLIAAGLLIAWSVGLIFAYEDLLSTRIRFWRELIWGVCSLPTFSLGMQLPLWGAKGWLGWNWHPALRSSRADWQLSIFDLLVATAVVAGTLAVARAASIPNPLTGQSEEQWLGIGLFFAAGLGLSLITLLPLVGIYQLRWSLHARWGLALAIAFVTTTISLVIPASGLIRVNVYPQAVIGLYSVVFWYVVTVCGGLTLRELYSADQVPGAKR
jgi:hypothetical protein